jgi:hypothetical protein
MLRRLDFHQVLDSDHHTTPYNTYDHRWVPFSHAPDGMREKIFICMQKSENGPLIGGVENLMKIRRWWIEGSGTWSK